jgi:hypothetical protein
MTRFAARPLAACVAILAVALLANVAVPYQAGAQDLRQRELSPNGAWSWFGDPRAVYHRGAHSRTYVGWVDSEGNIRVASYDHDTQARTVATIRANFQIDDHVNPSLLVRPDGRLIAFYSAHIGTAMYYRQTVRPEDVTSWGPERTVPTNVGSTWGYTYPNPVQLSAEGDRIWLFWRGGNFNPTFSTSDDALTWAPARSLVNSPGHRPYLKVASDGDDEIHFAFTQAHPRNAVTNIYYARYQAGNLHRANDSLIEPVSALPMSLTQPEKVYDAAAHGNVKAWVHDVAIGQDGNPIVVFATFPTNGDHRYHYARWNGTRWVDREFAHAGGSMSPDGHEPNYSGGATLDHEDPSRVYLSRQIGGVFQIEQWTTDDGGATWASRTVTAAAGGGNYRPVSPRGRTDPDLDIVWMRGPYPSYTRFQTGIDAELLSQDVFSPTVTDLGSGQLQLLARDGAGGLIRKGYAGAWSGWEDVGPGPDGHSLGSPAVTSSAPGRTDMFTVDQTTGRLLHRIREGGTWSDWVDLGAGPAGHPVAAPAAASWARGRLDVFARDTVNSELLHWWFDGAWRGPEWLMSTAGGAYVPSVASWGPRRLDIFAINSEGRLAHAWFDGRWHRWEDLGVAPGRVKYATPAAVSSWGPRRLDVFAATSGGRTLAHHWFDGRAWRGPETRKAGTGPDKIRLSGMAVSTWAPGHIDVFSTNSATRGLVHSWFNGRWNGPERLDFADTTATILADPNPRSTPIPVDPRVAQLGSN